MFADKISDLISKLEQEIEIVREDMERNDAHDSHRFDLRKKLADLQRQLESNQKLLRVFGLSDTQEDALKAVNL